LNFQGSAGRRYSQLFYRIGFIGLLFFQMHPLISQTDLLGTGNSRDLISMPVVSDLTEFSFWFTPSMIIADYSYESDDNELYLAAAFGMDWKKHWRITAILPVHRSHPEGVAELFHDLEWNPGRSRIRMLFRLKEYRGVGIGVSAGFWQLPVSRYWDDPLENHWCRNVGLQLEKSADFGLVAFSAEFVRFSDSYNLENNRQLLWHLGIGYRQNLSDRFIFIGEICYDQANPKYLTATFAEVQNWYLLNLGLDFQLNRKVIIRAGFSVGFRDEIVLVPKDQSRFDLAKESLQLSWYL
jgi:hypothetical protein